MLSAQSDMLITISDGGRAMDKAWQEKVRARAHALWEREGCPEGRAEHFWLMAEEELRAERRRPGGWLDYPWTEDMVDEALKGTFPASDPPAWVP